LLSACAFAYASQPIKLIVNGKEIQCDVPPQNIDGRVIVPARYVAEPLGAIVKWDAANNAVVVTSEGRKAVAQEPAKEVEKEVSNIKTYTENGVEYWSAWDIINVDPDSKGYSLRSKDYDFSYNKEKNTMSLVYNNKPGRPVDSYKTILEDIPIKIINGRSCIAKDYYFNNILPLVE